MSQSEQIIFFLQLDHYFFPTVIIFPLPPVMWNSLKSYLIVYFLKPFLVLTVAGGLPLVQHPRKGEKTRSRQWIEIKLWWRSNDILSWPSGKPWNCLSGIEMNKHFTSASENDWMQVIWEEYHLGRGNSLQLKHPWRQWQMKVSEDRTPEKEGHQLHWSGSDSALYPLIFWDIYSSHQRKCLILA